MKITKNDSLLLLDMLKHQHALNVHTCGIDYLTTGTTKNNRPIYWGMCISGELIELVDSLPYEHWKSVSLDDRENARVEAIDAGHFILSWLLELTMKNNHSGVTVSESNVVSVLHGLMTVDMEWIPESETLSHNIGQNLDNERVYEIVMLLNVIVGIPYLDSEETLNSLGGSFISELMCSILVLHDMLMIDSDNGYTSIENFYIAYMAKNALNEIRQDNGYKDGTYAKVFNYNGADMQDNKVMFEVILPEFIDKYNGSVSSGSNVKQLLRDKYIEVLSDCNIATLR